jgi:hypothetical protein
MATVALSTAVSTAKKSTALRCFFGFGYGAGERVNIE